MTSPHRPGGPSRPGGPKRPTAPQAGAANYSTSTTSGIEPNVAAPLAYILGPITGLLFLVLEKQNRFIRFHAAQSLVVGVLLIILHVGVSLLSGVLAFIPFLGALLVFIFTAGLALGTFLLWLLLMVKAYQGEELQLPVAGEIARKLS